MFKWMGIISVINLYKVNIVRIKTFVYTFKRRCGSSTFPNTFSNWVCGGGGWGLGLSTCSPEGRISSFCDKLRNIVIYTIKTNLQHIDWTIIIDSVSV